MKENIYFCIASSPNDSYNGSSETIPRVRLQKVTRKLPGEVEAYSDAKSKGRDVRKETTDSRMLQSSSVRLQRKVSGIWQKFL
ncbi:hypothetical protein AMTR_s00095p00118840 [Amborella trichopoda]|uniref:Uncharacterized protein n=1 Tax=Amborella trichopoda TaxID=13333 RepID=W1NU66_AMBTC|nr:hypothetical protein AMTR_s00095p00118840 [Amborella trichopoda]